ncbi:MAG: D-aminoacyl-tRNA deacylase, partial [Clostridia bacterium]|nr:D-aminoacyl-tRNA deacylase [Clostridia bacterium]
MIAVLQRVSSATVYADGEFSGEIGKGLYILLGVEKGDTEADATLLSEKIAKLRIFSDDGGKMNLSVMDIDGEIMVVSNFTLSANYE